MIMQGGCLNKCFGWGCAADSEEYQNFLGQFLSALNIFLKQNNLFDRVMAHISDEPAQDAFEHYSKLNQIVKGRMPGICIMDAVSAPEYVNCDNIDMPVVLLSKAAQYAGKVKHMVYYCNEPRCGYFSNRLFGMSALRNRIIGVQMYLNQASGFLHWGFNFYSAAFSLYKIDPYSTTDCGGYFPSGDAFVVYPHKDGAVSSTRWEVFSQAIRDWRALKTLEATKGREFVFSLIKSFGINNYDTYPHDHKMLLSLRQHVNNLIKNR